MIEIRKMPKLKLILIIYFQKPEIDQNLDFFPKIYSANIKLKLPAQ